MNKDSHKEDGFYELMQTQHLLEIPSFLESNIMKKIEPKIETKSSPIKIQAIIIFSLQICTYVIFSFISAYYFPHSILLNDFKKMVLLGAIAHIIYEINDIIPHYINQKLSV